MTPRSPSGPGAPCAMSAAASRVALKWPIRLTVMTRVKSSSLAGLPLLTVFAAVPMPAQLTRTFRPPRRWRASPSARSTSAPLVTSAGVNGAAAPSAAASSAPRDVGRSRIAARPPAFTIRSTVARPSPDAPPVTTACTLLSSMGPSRGRILAERSAAGAPSPNALCWWPMRTPYRVTRRRRLLCIYPAYARSFGTFQHAYPLFGGRVRAFMPPQGLLVMAAYLPEAWEVRFIDENSRRATDADFRWADAVLTSGMHVQRARIADVIARAHAHGRPVVLGGPSVSGCPEYYPEADLLHVGELGDATDRGDRKSTRLNSSHSQISYS